MSLIKSDGSHPATLYTNVYAKAKHVYDLAVLLPGMSHREVSTCIPQRRGQECSQ